MSKKKKPAAAKAGTVAVAKPALLTAREIEKNCPAHVEGWGKQAAAHYDKATLYESKAEQHWIAIGRYLAKAKEACDGGGFAAFREKFCPHLGKTRINELLRIGTGEKTPEETKSATRERVRKSRAAKKAAEATATVAAEYAEPPVVRLNGGQEIDITEQGAAAQAQLAEKLLPATSGPKGRSVEEQRKAATESRAGGTFLTDAEFKALTADKLRELIGDIFFDNVDIENFDDFMGMTADELREQLEGFFGADFCGVVRFEDGSGLSLWFGDKDFSAVADDPPPITADDPPPITYESDVDGELCPVVPPWFEEKLTPILEGKIKNDEAGSALALRQCLRALPQMTAKDLGTIADLSSIIWEIREDVEAAKRIKREAKNPEKAKDKARRQAQDEEMQDELEYAAKNNDDRWDKDEWVKQWIAENWGGSDAEAEFEKDFAERWTREHGSDFPLHVGA